MLTTVSVLHQETVHVSVALRSATKCYGALLRHALFPDVAPDVFAHTGLANCPVDTLSLSIPFYMTSTDIAVEEHNDLLRSLLCQVCATNLSHLHICIDVGAESTTRARILLSSVD